MFISGGPPPPPIFKLTQGPPRPQCVDFKPSLQGNLATRSKGLDHWTTVVPYLVFQGLGQDFRHQDLYYTAYWLLGCLLPPPLPPPCLSVSLCV